MGEGAGTPGRAPSFREEWGNIDRMADPGAYVRFMDTVFGTPPDDPQRFRNVIEALRIAAGSRVLDVGCGLGGAARALATLVGPAGRIVGVDNSATMIAEAWRRADGRSLPVEFRVGDAHALPFADGTFDGSYAQGVFEVVADPERALAEMVRVVRPGGRVFLPTPDLGTVAVNASDVALTRRILDYWCDQDTNGWVGRRMPGLCKAAGLVDVTVRPGGWVMTDYARQLWWPGVVERAQTAGVISPDEGAAWLRDLEAKGQAGECIYAGLSFHISGQKP
jgi:SAM-dependent methyltransferase